MKESLASGVGSGSEAAPCVLASPRAQELVREAVNYLGAQPAERAGLASLRTKPRQGSVLQHADRLWVDGAKTVRAEYCMFCAEPGSANPEGATEMQRTSPFQIPEGWRVRASHPQSCMQRRMTRTLTRLPLRKAEDLD